MLLLQYLIQMLNVIEKKALAETRRKTVWLLWGEREILEHLFSGGH